MHTVDPLGVLEGGTGPDLRASLIVLHGLGAEGNDFVPFAEQLDLSAVDPARFIFPHAPERPVTINGGDRMRAWSDGLGHRLARPRGGARHRRLADRADGLSQG